MAKTKSKSIYFLKLVRKLLVLIGIFFSTCVILAFTDAPFWAYHWLGTSKTEMKWEPKTIVLLGGGGMPSKSNLMRSWYVEKAATNFPGTSIIIAMPGDINDSLSTPRLMQEELLRKGIRARRIRFEDEGTNTRSQALNCMEHIKVQEALLLVTSPEHMRRSVLSFKQVGFEKVNALPAFENAAEADFSFDDDELGGNYKIPIPDVGNNTNLRYRLWNHLHYELLFAREITALCYYKLRGWI